jgi:hypothetical protein
MPVSVANMLLAVERRLRTDWKVTLRTLVSLPTMYKQRSLSVRRFRKDFQSCYPQQTREEHKI